MMTLTARVIVRTVAGTALALAGALALCALPAWSAASAPTGAASTTAATALRAAVVATSGQAWQKVADPFVPAAGARAIATFGSAGVAVAGTGGKIAVSTNGGASWTLRSLPAGGSPVTAVAFSDAHHGWALDTTDGVIDETTDGGVTWTADPQTGTFAALAAASAAPLVCVLTPASVLTATSVAAPNWTSEASTVSPFPATSPSIVAGAGGFAAAIDAAGTLITRASDGTWTSQTGPGSAVLALTPSPVWGNGVPDLFAITAGDVQGSDDQGGSFQDLTPPATASSLLSGAVLGSPRPQLLVTGQSGLLERYLLTSGTWATDNGPLTGTLLASAAGPGGAAYALSSDGHVERTLSYGATPFSLSASAGTVTAGSAVRFTVASGVRAPGTLALQARPAGGAWKTAHAWAWKSIPPKPGAVSLKPLATTQYRLGFLMGGRTVAVSGTVSVSVRSRISVARTTFGLSRGATYRVTGTVYPAQAGRSVTIWTTRGGAWHQVASGGVVALVHGTTFTTRLFGTPLRETYHLQVRLGASSSRLAAVSPLIKVTVR